jgi:plastocyanin
MKTRGLLVGGMMVVALGLVGCGGGGGGGGGGGPVELTVGTGPDASLVFDPTTISAPPNTEVRLTFQNEGTISHNLAFQGGITAKTADDVPAGESETIEFTTPGPGDYQYVCTVHPGMEGTLTVAAP